MSSNANDEEVTVNQAGFQFTYYPGFCREAQVRAGNAAPQQLFEQSQTFNLPGNQTKPNTEHFLRLEGGSRNQDVTLRIEDPKLRIASITIELYGEDYDPNNDTERQVAETLSVANDPSICPPDCGPPL
jgi:hypothetical protein